MKLAAILKTTVLALVWVCLGGAMPRPATAATPVALFEGDTLVDAATYTATNGVVYTLAANGNTAIAGGGIQISGTKGVSITPSSGNIGNQASTVIIRYTGYDTSSLTTTDAQALIINHTANTTYKDFLGMAATAGGNLWGVWKNTTWGSNKTTNGKYGSTASDTKKFALAWDQYSTVQLGSWFWMDGGDKQGWSGLHGNLQIDSIWVGGPNESTTVKPATGMKILSIAVFDCRLTDDEITGFKFPSEGGPAVYGAIWGNIGTSKTDPGSCSGTKSGGTYNDLTLNFSKSDNMSHTGIAGTGRVRITKVRFVRNGTSAKAPAALTLSQADGTTAVSASATLLTGQHVYWASGSQKTVATFDYVFDSDVQFDTSQDISVTFASKATIYTILPANSVFKVYDTSKSADYTPAIEVTGDWTPPRILSVNIAQYWNGNNGSTTDNPTIAGQVTTDQTTLLGTVPAAAWAQSAADNIPTIESSGRGSTFSAPKMLVGSSVVDNPSATKVRAYFAAGTNLNKYDTFANTFRQTMLTAKNTNAGSGDITVTDIPFDLYDAIIYMSSTSANAMNPVSVNGTYLVPTDVEGVNTKAASATSPTWGNGQTEALTYGANVMRVNALSGDLAIQHTAASWGIAAVQIVERGSTTYSATVSADTEFSDIVWTPEVPATGFAAGDKLILTTEGTPTISFANAYSTEAALTISGAAKIAASDDFYEDGCFIKTFASFAKLTAESVTYADVKSGFTGAYGKTATGFTLRAQNREVISINFAGGTSVSGTDYAGLAAVQGDTWNNLTDTWSSRTTKTLESIAATADGVTAAASPGVTLEATANNTYNWNGATDAFLKGYLDDGGQANVTVSGIPYTTYDVIVYAATDTDGRSFRAVTVNGTAYTYDDDNPSTAKAGSDNWGASRGLVAEYGRNAIRIRNQTATTLAIVGGTNGDGARGGIAAIQIVCTGSVITGTDYFAEATASGAISALAWTPETLTSGRLNTATVAVGADVAEPLSLDFDAAYTLMRFAVTNAAEQAVNLTANGATPAIDTYDFSGATGRVEMAFSTGSSHVIAGGDTVLPAGGTGKLSFGDNATATVTNGDWAGTISWKADAVLRLKGAEMSSVPYVSATAGKVIYALPFAEQTAEGGVQFAGTLNRDFEDGFALTTTRFVLGNNGGSTQVFTQRGGSLTVTGSTGPGSNQAAVLLGHYGNGESTTYNLNGGSFTAENAAIQLGWDGNCYFTIAGGTLRTKGIASGLSSHDQPAAFTLESGALEIGDYGIQAVGAYAAYTLNGGTVRAYADATISVAHADGLRIAGPVTFEAAAGKVLRVLSDNVTSGGAITVGGAGVVAFAHYRGPATVAETAKIGYVVNVNDLGTLRLPDGMTADRVMLYDLAGNVVPFTEEEEGVLKFDWGVVDGNCLWDYGFNGNLTSTGSDETTMTAEGTEPYYNDDLNRLWVGHATPYRSAAYSAEFTAVMRGRIVGVQKQIEIGFGSTTGGSKYSVALACGDPANEEVLLLISQGYTVLETVSMTVPHACDGDHLYAFSCKTADVGGVEKTQVTVYLDGNRMQVYTFDAKVVLGSGFQVGSVHGLPPTGYAKADTSAANDDAMLDFLRVYPVAITDEAMTEYAKKYPYVSPNGTAEREFDGAATWTADKTWRVTPYEGEAYATNKPPAQANVAISAASASTVTFDLAEAANYETFTATNGAAITLRKGGSTKPSVKGFMTVGMPLTVDYDAMTLTDTPIIVQDGATLSFDFRSLDVSGYWASATNVLTGAVTLRDDAQVTGVNLPTAAGRTVAFVINEETQRCELRITVVNDPFICTVDADGTKTWTWAGQPTTEAVADAHLAYAIWKEGEGTLTKALANRSYAVNGGTFKISSASGKTATLTVNADGTLDLNGSYDGYLDIVLDGGRLLNNGTSRGGGSRQMRGLTLLSDSTLGGTGDFGLVANQWAANTLALGGRLLTKTGSDTFILCNTTVTGAGAIDIRGGAIEIYKTSTFADGVITNAGTVKIDASQTFTVGTIVGGTINNAGTLGAVTLAGEVALTGAGTYGAITLADDAVVDIAQKRGLAIGGTGTVDVTLTADEVNSGTFPITIFTPAIGSAVAIGTVTYEGEDITDRCTIQGGTITDIVCEAQIGAKKYVTLSDAISSVSSGGTILLLRDVALPSSVASDRAFTLDVNGRTLTVAGCLVRGDMTLANGAAAGGVEFAGDLRTVEDGARVALALASVGGSGRILVEYGTLATAGATVVEEGVDIVVEANGTLDLSAGTSLACDRFASSGGGCTGTAATLIVTGTLDARGETTLTCLELADGATLQAGQLVVTDRLAVDNRFLYVETGNDDFQVARVPAGTSTDRTRITYNGVRGYQLVCAGTDLKAAWYSNRWIDYADAGGVTKEGDTYVVTTAAGLAWLAAQSTNGWVSGTVKLDCDIDLSGWNWVPIAQFTGAFDGFGHAIAGLNNTNFVARFGAAARYAHGVTNDWNYSAYGLVGSATNAVFRRIAFRDAAIASTADSVAALLGVHAGGDLSISGVTVEGRVEGAGRAVAGVATVGGNGEPVGDLGVSNNVCRATIAGSVADGADGGNVAQILAGTTWDTVFTGTVVATNNTGAGAFEVSVNDAPWRTSTYGWLDLPVCNLAAAVLHTDDDGAFRSYLEANATGAVPVDPETGKARMLAGRFASGESDTLGWWSDQISSLPAGATLVIPNEGEAIEFDGWSTVAVDRDLTIDLKENSIYQVYDCDVFDIAPGVTLTVRNGKISVGPGCEAFAGAGKGVCGEGCEIVRLSESFEGRTFEKVKSASMVAGKMSLVVPQTSVCCQYGVEMKTSLADDWQVVPDSAARGTGGDLELEAPAEAASGFYRVNAILDFN